MLAVLYAPLPPWRAAAEEATAAAPGPAASGDLLARIMDRLARGGGVKARFRETKHLSLLTHPLETEGLLYFDPPDRLARYATSPGSSSVVVREGRVTFRDETGSQVIELASNPVARSLVEDFAVLLRGDLEALRSRHAIRISGGADRWTLELEPRNARARAIIASIRVEGRGGGLDRMEVVEQNGDRTVTTFSEVESGIVFAPDQRDRLFPGKAGEAPR